MEQAVIEGVVVLGYGPQPVSFLKKANAMCGGSKAVILDQDVGRMAGASFAIGEPAVLAELRQRLEAGALQAARQNYHGKLSPEAIRWLANGERGMSSEALFTRLSGINCTKGTSDGVARVDHPYDPADFRRCRLMLEACPELAVNLKNAAGMSPQWKDLVYLWDEICAAMDEECPNWRKPYAGSAPKTYALIKRAIGR
jgi:hypothetical protein